MNKVFLIGRLSRDPELRHTTSGMPVCQINVAISRPVGQGKEPETDFINVVVWNKQAENVSKYLAKGRQIAIAGRIQTDSYTAQDGTKRYTTDVVVESFEFCDSSNKSNSSNNSIDDDVTPVEDGDMPF